MPIHRRNNKKEKRTTFNFDLMNQELWASFTDRCDSELSSLAATTGDTPYSSLCHKWERLQECILVAAKEHIPTKSRPITSPYDTIDHPDSMELKSLTLSLRNCRRAIGLVKNLVYADYSASSISQV